MIALYDKGAHLPLMWTHLIPATLEGRYAQRAERHVRCGDRVFDGHPVDSVCQGLRTFDTTFQARRAAWIMSDEHPFKVIFDCTTGVHAVGVMADLAGGMEVANRLSLSWPDWAIRRDEDIVAIAETVAGKLVHGICRRDDDLRGREPDAVPKMIAGEVLRDKGVSEAQITIIPDEQEAIDAALRMGRQGDLCWCLPTRWPGPGSRSPSSAQKVPATAAPSTKAPPLPVDDASDSLLGTKGDVGDGALESAGFVRDERGIRFVKDSED